MLRGFIQIHAELWVQWEQIVSHRSKLLPWLSGREENKYSPSFGNRKTSHTPYCQGGPGVLHPAFGCEVFKPREVGQYSKTCIFLSDLDTFPWCRFSVWSFLLKAKVCIFLSALLGPMLLKHLHSSNPTKAVTFPALQETCYDPSNDGNIPFFSLKKQNKKKKVSRTEIIQLPEDEVPLSYSSFLSCVLVCLLLR